MKANLNGSGFGLLRVLMQGRRVVILFRNEATKDIEHMKMIRLKILGVALLATTVVANAELPAIELTPEWVATIQKAAPEKPAVSALKTRKALLFSAMTGFKHWCTPHTAEMLKILGKKSGAYEVVESNDANMFAPENIKQF
ncbi:MAG: hypothetical protein OSB41_08635, partial [Kiritimatiellae bacterium]|nr:hypothetical protein [Kiritimatiellia bacterium]